MKFFRIESVRENFDDDFPRKLFIFVSEKILTTGFPTKPGQHFEPKISSSKKLEVGTGKTNI